ncbi:division/cell wall cluster transcriptional repressor MraZ [uncultured Ramlibacter sp.]|uniref:division/cell wall cluster transcriptional repressor MraZ n=1 Tax=uncultured Ramlibacter sp. TaxID=260755 RepID=UPI002617DECA|nr:division/cell wall cluster transcriptional repressor MraZ [uncultured Ramlibacter sp.]
MFQGPSALTLDNKGRIAMPVRHRDVLTAMGASKVTITKNPPGGLLVFPPAAWEDFSARVSALPMESSGWKRLFLGNAVEVEFDASSRLLIAPELREFADLSRDVMLLGMGNFLELWDKRRYDEHEAQVVASAMPESIKNFIL